MKNTFVHFLRITLFLLILFAIARLGFLLANNFTDKNFSWISALPAFVHGMRMDLSVIAYFLLIPLLISFTFAYKPIAALQKAEKYYWNFILLIVCLVLPANIVLYNHWQNLLNFRSLSYLQDFGHIFSSFSLVQTVITIGALLFFIVICFIFFHKYSYSPLQKVNDNAFVKKGWMIVLTSLTILMLRGGVQMLPMNESLVSYSENNFLNQSAINPCWHLANDVYRAGIFSGNPFETMPAEEARKRTQELLSCVPDSFPRILSTDAPNIVFILLESFTADVVGAMGAKPGVSPALDQLISEGMLFDEIYSSGTRTDQGIVSLLNGWPATPYHSIMRSPEKLDRLPSLPLLFLEKKYNTSFYYGGKSNFSNLNVYCFKQKFQRIIDEKDFSDSIPRGRWGVHDEHLFDRVLTDISSTREPFFTVLLTLSNHEPFDVPGEKRVSGNDSPSLFRNAAAYTDASLGAFMKKAKRMPWFENTLFIISADHGHGLPLNKNVYYPDSHRIPFLFYGPVIREEFRGSVVSKLGGHHDLPGTLLPQLGMSESDSFFWSKNLLNPTSKSFAYYQIDHMLGWIDTPYWFGFSYNRKKFIARSHKVAPERLDSMRLTGQAFIQELYDHYRKY